MIAGRPSLFTFLGFYWEAFQRLSKCRPLGPTSVGDIPWTAMDQYATRFEIDNPYQYDYFIYLMEGLDETYLAETASKDTKGQGSKGGK